MTTIAMVRVLASVVLMVLGLWLVGLAVLSLLGY